MYHVTWEIDAEDVDTPEDAASFAWETVRSPAGIASVFTVTAPNGQQFIVDLFLGTSLEVPRDDNRRVPYPGTEGPSVEHIP